MIPLHIIFHILTRKGTIQAWEPEFRPHPSGKYTTLAHSRADLAHYAAGRYRPAQYSMAEIRYSICHFTWFYNTGNFHRF